MNHEHVAVITGAGSGIGRATAVALARKGHRIALLGRTTAKLTETAGLILSEGGDENRVLVIEADVAVAGSCKAAVDSILNPWGRVDVLVNNAAALEIAPIWQPDDRAVHTVFETNVFGPLRLIVLLWPAFIAQKRGCIVNVSSVAALDPFAGLGVYASSKAALESLTRSIRNEEPTGSIRAFNVAPGAVETAMLRQVVSVSQLPGERALSPTQVAEVIVECVMGLRDDHHGRTILVPSP